MLQLLTMNAKGQILQQIDDLITLGILRGSLTTQTYTKKDKHGDSYQQGPYFVYTVSIKGSRTTKRVPAENVKQYEEAIARGKKVKELFNRLMEIGEQG